MPKHALAKYERAEAAHANGMENAPYFIGAVLAGNLAGLSACKYVSNCIFNTSDQPILATMNMLTGAYIGLRVIYNVLYINTTTLKNSRARSLVWIAGTFTLFTLYFKAANRLLVDS